MISLNLTNVDKVRTVLFDDSLTMDAYIEALNSIILNQAQSFVLTGTRKYVKQRAFGKNTSIAEFPPQMLPQRRVRRQIKHLIPRKGSEVLYRTI